MATISVLLSLPKPTATAIGVARVNAQGQEMASTAAVDIRLPVASWMMTITERIIGANHRASLSASLSTGGFLS
ncbi:MAG: hypothetical protein QG670_668 [Thermoproteota archaeon]|nr:hypothetical protein [Thermoproteota archaeon]